MYTATVKNPQKGVQEYNNILIYEHEGWNICAISVFLKLAKIVQVQWRLIFGSWGDNIQMFIMKEILYH